MSWDIFIQEFPDGATRVADVPDTFTPPSIGARSAVIAKIKSALPAVDFTDPAWGIYREEDCSIEFGMGDDDVVRSLTLHVRGSDAVLTHISSVLSALGLRAIDSWTGEFYDAGVAPLSLKRWRNYIEAEG